MISSALLCIAALKKKMADCWPTDILDCLPPTEVNLGDGITLIPRISLLSHSIVLDDGRESREPLGLASKPRGCWPNLRECGTTLLL